MNGDNVNFGSINPGGQGGASSTEGLQQAERLAPVGIGVGEEGQSPQRAQVAITAVKAAHTLIFLGMASCVLYTFYSGLTGRVSRLTRVSIIAVTCEALVYSGNGFRCPLADLAEELGSEHGTVGDIFLPDWFARRIPVVSSTLFMAGLVGIELHRLKGGRK